METRWETVTPISVHSILTLDGKSGQAAVLPLSARVMSEKANQNERFKYDPNLRKFQLKITQHTKNQEDLKLNGKKTINRCQH